MIHALWLWFLHVTGSDNTSGIYYGFWSGFGSDLGEIALLGSLVAIYRHHNCAVRGCPRFGHHPVKNTHFKTCHRHNTAEWHRSLQIDHSEEFPEQHKFIKEKQNDSQSVRLRVD